MPLTAHLTELRGRILWSILAIAVGGSIGFAWGEPIVEAFKAQLPSDVELQQIELGDGFAIRIQIAFVVGRDPGHAACSCGTCGGSSAPGLTPGERRSVLPWIPAALVFFAIGVTIAYIILPFATTFLLSFVPEA
jgi:sec-independent protein translocase protein TatC